MTASIIEYAIRNAYDRPDLGIHVQDQVRAAMEAGLITKPRLPASPEPKSVIRQKEKQEVENLVMQVLTASGPLNRIDILRRLHLSDTQLSVAIDVLILSGRLRRHFPNDIGKTGSFYYYESLEPAVKALPAPE